MNPSAPRVVREVDSDSLHGLSPSVTPKDIDRIFSETSDDISVEKFEESRHDAADPVSRDVDSNPTSLAKPSEDSSLSNVVPSIIDLSVGCSESRRIDSAWETNFTPLSKPLSKVGQTSSRQLATCLSYPHDDSRPR